MESEVDNDSEVESMFASLIFIVILILALTSDNSLVVSEIVQLPADVQSSDDYNSESAPDDTLSELWWAEPLPAVPDTLQNYLTQENNISASLSEDSSHESSSGTEHMLISDPDCVQNENQAFFKIPDTLKGLRQQLLGGYTLPPHPPENLSAVRTLTATELHSLRHYVAWKTSNGTIRAYKHHAIVLAEASRVEILPLNRVQKLAQELTEFIPKKFDMCPRSCIAYTGKYETLLHCPYIPSGKGAACNEPRYHPQTVSQRRLRPRAQVQILPVMATVRAMFANAETSTLLRNRDSCLQKALHLIGTVATRKYSDYGNSQVHIMQYLNLDLFHDPRDIGFALSTDGAQLTMKKHSNTWLMILVILNLPGSIRYKTNNVIINFATPGPNSPGDIESFIWPLFQEMATASEGIWIWDALDSSYFVHKSCISMALGDMLGSAKLNGMAGHTAIFGDRFSTVQGAKSSRIKGAKSQYYPVAPPDNQRYNPLRPEKYDLSKIPMRSQDEYWKIIERLDKARTKKERSEITKSTGVSRLPLCAASVAFMHPTFFPIDPFHLFYENCMAFIWDTWTTLSKHGDPVHLTPEKAQELGRLVALAMPTLPPAFCGPIRDPYLKRQSQYKIYEWMALLHWYIIPISIELSFHPAVLKNFSRFVYAIEFSMTIQPRSDSDIQHLHDVIAMFLEEYEQLYIGSDPEKILRARLCLFQLIHVPHHIQWNGSIRLGSQATVERSIGEMGHQIRSKKAPFANLTNIIYERELIKILSLYYPTIKVELALQTDKIKISKAAGTVFMQRDPIRKGQVHVDGNISLEIDTISQWLGIGIIGSAASFERWGKLKLPNGHVLGSRLSTQKGKSARRCEWFEVCSKFNLTIVQG